MSHQPRPGVSRQQRLSEEGLRRLERQLRSSMRVGEAVLLQWVRRYGDAAIRRIEENGRMTESLRAAIDQLQVEASGSLP